MTTPTPEQVLREKLERIAPVKAQKGTGRHVCGRCGMGFRTKYECWFHMDNECERVAREESKP